MDIELVYELVHNKVAKRKWIRFNNIYEQLIKEDCHDVTYETINHWKNGRKNIDSSNLEKLYSYAYLKGGY